MRWLLGVVGIAQPFDLLVTLVDLVLPLLRQPVQFLLGRAIFRHLLQDVLGVHERDALGRGRTCDRQQGGHHQEQGEVACHTKHRK